ncbi:3D domain-containing protein [Oribacterium sp. NK2B42]|uniref:3D domain-containing protein n=1 Tax=Oribacterium sp. NK2B42 TaxID=689781 RepID=UPI0004121CC6|nr:3D domain-containing protein [Oribacterium sp. NK2B42]
MKMAGLKTAAATLFITALVSTSALAAATAPTGTAWSDESMVKGYELVQSSDSEMDAEIQAEMYAEQLLAEQLKALETAAKQSAGNPVTKVGSVVTEETTHYKRGNMIGNFKLTGYYGAGITYSGAYTTANHTIAADLGVIPMGTKVFINNTVYTVEDIGGAVKGNLIDVYYDTYAEAAGVTDRGWQYADVYLAVPV